MEQIYKASRLLNKGSEIATKNPPESSVDLYWIPLGAGAHVVRVSGSIFEAIYAAKEHRSRAHLYHSALVVNVPDGRYIIEQTPVPDNKNQDRGVVAEGPVGMRWLGHLRMFRYEVRCWKDGIIPDLSYAVGGAVKATNNIEQAEGIIENIRSIPTLVWGRDENHTGEMWNSNSVISWVLTQSGIDTSSLSPPDGGRAPGWDAGTEVACKYSSRADES